MFSYSAAYGELSAALQHLYDTREAAAIAHAALEHVTGAGRLQRLTDRDKLLTAEQAAQFNEIKAGLLSGSPMQYVLGYAWFMGGRFTVNEHVLIPRPETEELVQWIVDDSDGLSPSVIDIGTGSGCIPVSLKLLLPQAKVTATDISEGALAIAKKNAGLLGADVQFINADFLDTGTWQELGQFDIIVSNPPYIPDTEKETLGAHVREHEPGQALFVPGNDALLFYRHIADFAQEHLAEGGAVYCELHVDYAAATQELFRSMGYTHTELRTDMHGNLRMLKAKK
ncbi:MAG TPA: peptide chain release factor N(5)-glutamine methyltransferase [Flavipsychrobacter sp.]